MRDPGKEVACYVTEPTLVQSLNSPFFPPHIGTEPVRAKEESRITCMRMLRTSQSKIPTTPLASMCRAMPCSARAQKVNIFFDVDIVVNNIKASNSKYGLSWPVLLSTTSTFFPNIFFFVLFLHG